MAGCTNGKNKKTKSKRELIYIIVFSALSLLLGLESFITHLVAFIFGLVVGVVMQKKTKIG